MNDDGRHSESRDAAEVRRRRERELEERIIAVIRGLRPQSQWAVEQFTKLLEVEGVPGCLVMEKPLKPGDPVEASFLGNLALDTRDRYVRATRGR